MQKFLRTLTLLAFLIVPWVMQGQNANVSEYDMSYSTAAYSSVATAGGNMLTFTNGSADVTMPFAMYFGTTQIASGSTLKVKADGSVSFASIVGSYIAPLRYTADYVGGNVYALSTGSKLTIEWRKVTQGGKNIYSFQLCLFPNGNIEFHYGPMTLASSINVLVGMRSVATDYFLVRGEGGTTDWNTMERVLNSDQTRALSATTHPDYSLTTNKGAVYTFTKPACVKPTMSSVSATAWDTVLVSWTNSSNPDSYQIAYSTNPDINFATAAASEYTAVNVNSGTATPAKVKVPTANTTYYFAVRAKCGDNYSGWSAVADATTPTGCPTLSAFNTTAVTSTGATLNWTASMAATSYDIRYNLGDDFDPAENEGTLVTSTTTSKALTGLTGASTYYYYVSANCVSGLVSDWDGPHTFNTACGAMNVPYTQNFEGYDMPSCWSEDVILGTNTWQYQDGNIAYSWNSGNKSRMISPVFNISAAGNYQVDFYHAECNDGSYQDSLYVYYRTSATSDWVLLGMFGNATDHNNIQLEHTTIALPNPSATYQLAFEGQGHGGYNVYLMGITVGLEPTCPTPSGIAATAEGVVTWTAGNNNTSYDLVYGPAGFTSLAEGTLIENITGTTYTLTGLVGATSYDVYIRAHCSATSELTDWVGPASFTTPCMPIAITPAAPYVENFESYTYTTSSYESAGADVPLCWVVSPTDVSRGVHVGTLGAASGNGLVMTAGTSSCIPNNIAILPAFTIPLTQLQIAFDSKVESGNLSTYLYLGYVTNANDTSTFVALQQIPSTSAVNHTEYTFTGDIPAGARIAFKLWRSAIYYWGTIDNVVVSMIPTCAKPVNLAAVPSATESAVTASLSWTETSPTPATQWEVRYWKAGTTDTFSVVANANPYTLGNLEMASTYNWQVRALCSAEEHSDWSAVSNFSEPNCITGPVAIGNGTSNVTYGPVYSSYGNTFYQVIYTAEELLAAGLTAGNINELSFTWSTSSTAKDKDFTIFIGTTDKSSFSSKTDYVDVTTLTQVYGPVTTTNATRANSPVYTFGAPFRWDGTSNVIICTFMNQCACSNNATGNSGFYAKGSTASVGASRALCLYKDDFVITSENYTSLTSGYVATYRPNIVFNPSAPCYQGDCVPPTVAIEVSEADYQATLTFTDNNEAAEPVFGYKYGVQGFDPATATEYTSTTATATITGLSPLTTYDVYVYAKCAGTAGRMVRYHFTTPYIPNCKEQQNFAASNVTYNTATVTWEQKDPAQVPEFWTVRYSNIDFDPATAAAADYTEVNILGTAGPTLNLTGLAAGNTYYIKVKATCDQAQGDVSPNWTAFSFNTPTCVVPAAVVAKNVTNSTAWIQWSAVDGQNSWTVRYSTDNTFTTYTDVTVDVDSVKLTGLDAYATYYAMVKANCTATDESDWSTVATFKTKCPDGRDVNIYGLGAATSQYYMPVNNFYKNSYCQQIITAEEMGAATTLYGIRFYYDYASGASKSDVTISLAHTAKDEFKSTTDWVPYNSDALTEVWSGTFSVQQGENEVIFTTPFEYNGADNLLVVVDDRSNTYNGDSSSKFAMCSTSGYKAMYYQSDSYNILDGTSMRTASNRLQYRNKMDFIAPCNTSVTCFAPVIDSCVIDSSNVVRFGWHARTDLEPIVNDYDINYGVKGFDPDRATQNLQHVGNVTTYEINALAETEYDLYVRTHCSESDQSNWTKVSFTSYPDVFAPVQLHATGNTPTSVSLAWTEKNPTPASSWQLVYGEPGFNPDNATSFINAANTTATVEGLHHTTYYDFYVRAVKGADVSPWSQVCTAMSGCGVWQLADMPLNENFDGYTGNTSGTLANHVMPQCWSYLNGGTNTTYKGLPSIYNTASYSHSSPNTLRFDSYNASTDADQYAILPEFGFDLDTLEVSFYGRFYNTASEIRVGVMSDPTDASTFELVQTVTAPSSGYNTQKLYEVSFSEYAGTGRYVAFMVPKAASNADRGFYMDDLTVKLREKVNNVPNTGGEYAICNEFVQPATQNGAYYANTNATYVVRPGQAGKVVRLSGNYDLEYGYDFVYVYEGEGANKTIIDTLTGTGYFDYMTESNDWVNHGAMTLVFRTDADNSLPQAGFKFLAQCVCPEPAADTVVTRHEANGTYTWNGISRDNSQVPYEAAPDKTEVLEFTVPNVAGCDSVYLRDTMILHPTYRLQYSNEICERDVYDFYGQQFTTTGTYEVPLQTVYGGDSIGVLTLTVHSAPTAGIYYNGSKVEQQINGFCDNAAMELLARSNVNGATFAWEDQSTDAQRTVTPHVNATYTVVATEPAYGCTSLPATLNVITMPVAEPTINATATAICVGQSTTLTVVDGASLEGVTYLWSNNQTGTSITVNPTETTTYTVTATTETGCATTASIEVVVNQLPVVTVSTSVNEICRDSVVTLNASVVEGYSYSWSNGATTAQTTVNPSATGSYTLTVTDQNNCANNFTTEAITVYPSYTVYDTMTVCYTQNPYTWGAMTLTEDGDYTQNFAIAHACDSLVHVNFAFREMSTINSYRELCEGTPYSHGGNAYVAHQDTVVHFVSTPLDCPVDSVLNLTVNHPTVTSFDTTVCDLMVWNGTNYDTPGTAAYEQTLATVKGCDSVVTMNLTVNLSNTGVDEQDVCDQLVWIDGNTYTEPNNAAQYTLKNAAGCDSVVTLNLTTVRHSTEGEDNITYCDAFTYTWINNVTYELSETGVRYKLPEPNVAGCDTTAILNLVMNPVRDTMPWIDTMACDELVVNTVTCEGDNEQTSIRENGEYLLRIHDAATDRDKIMRLRVTINKSTPTTTFVEGCLPYTWTVVLARDEHGDPVSTWQYTVEEKDHVGENTIYITKEIAVTENGCSQLAVLRLTAHHPVIETVEHEMCINDSWDTLGYNFYGNVMVENDDYEYDIARALTPEGCDSTLHLVFNVLDSAETIVFDTLFEHQFEYNEETGDYEYAWVSKTNIEDTLILTLDDGRHTEVPFDGAKTAVWSRENGCDSTVTVIYHVLPVLFSFEEDDTVCAEYTWVVDEHEVATVTIADAEPIYNGMYKVTLHDTLKSEQYQYDSIIVKDVYFWGSNDTTWKDITNVCTEYEWEGVTYWKDSTFFVKEDKPTVNGCDSVTAYRFHVIGDRMYDFNVVTNEPYKWQYDDEDTTYTQSTEKYVDWTSAGYCNEVLHLHLTILDGEYNYCVSDTNVAIVPVTNDEFIPSEFTPGHWYSEKTNGDFLDVINNAPYTYNDTLIGLYIRPVYNQLFDTVSCGVFTWNGVEYADTGIYTQVIPTEIYGCDSIVTYQLWVNNNLANDTNLVVEVCDEFVFDYSVDYTPASNDSMDATRPHEFSFSRTWTESIDTTIVVKNKYGCDSTINLSLTINKNTPVVLVDTACDSYIWTVANNAATDVALDKVYGDSEFGNFKYEFVATDANGCVAKDSLYLFVKHAVHKAWDTIVNGPSYNYTAVLAGLDTIVYTDGFEYTNHFFAAPTDINFFDTLHVNAVNGCDSIIDVHIVVSNGEVMTETKNECGRYTWTEADHGNGHTYQWISDAEANAHKNALNMVPLYKDITSGTDVYVYENPIDSVFVNGVLTQTWVLWLSLNEASFNDTTIARYPISLGYTINFFEGEEATGIDSLATTTFVIPADKIPTFANPSVTIDTTIMIEYASTYNGGLGGYYCANYFDIHMTVVYNYDTLAPQTVCYEQDGIDWNGRMVALAEGENALDSTFNEGTFDEQLTHWVVTRNAFVGSTIADSAVCEQFQWNIGDNDSIYTESTTNVITKIIANGCDSVVTITNLTVNHAAHRNLGEFTGCDSVYWGAKNGNAGKWYFTTTTDTINYLDGNGCLVVDTMTLTVTPTVHDVYTLDSCFNDGNAYDWHGDRTASGTYTYSYANTTDAFCTNVDTLKLTMRFNKTSNDDSTAYVVEGESFRIDGDIYTAGGVYTHNRYLTTDDKCDSTVYLTLTVLSYTSQLIQESACGIYTWETTNYGNGHTYRSITDEVSAAHDNALYEDITDGIAEADRWVLSNPVVTPEYGQPGYGKRYFLQLTLRGAAYGTVDSTYLLSNGNVMTYSGTDYDYSALVTAKAGKDTTHIQRVPYTGSACDSIVTLNVHIVYNYTHTDDTAVCAEHDNTYTWREKNWTLCAAGKDTTYYDTASKGTADEWIYTQKVARRAAIAVTADDTNVCDQFVWGGETFTKDTTNVTKVFTSVLTGCDSTVTIANIVVRHSSQFDSTVTNCDNFRLYNLAGSTYDSIYTVSTVDNVFIPNTANCDSMIVLHLTINKNNGSMTTVADACDEYTWTIGEEVIGTYHNNGSDINESGMKLHNFVDANGCYGNDTLVLTVNASSHVVDSEYVGEGSIRYQGILYVAPTYFWRYDTVWADENHTQFVPNAVGCYNITDVRVNVGNFYHKDEMYVKCNSFTWDRNGHSYSFIPVNERTDGALYYDVTAADTVKTNPAVRIANEGDQDSIIMLMLTLTQNTTSTVEVSFPVSLVNLTYGDSIFNYADQNDLAIDGGSFAGYEDVRDVHFASVEYCDSVVTVSIHVYNNYTQVATDDICATQTSYTWRGHEISTATTDYDHLQYYYVYDTVGTAEAPVIEYVKVAQHPIVYAVERRYACDSYEWNGEVFTENVTNYTKLFEGGSEFGCDSTVILHLTIYNTTSTYTEAEVCDTYTWNFGNNSSRTFTESIDTAAEYDNVYPNKTCHSKDSLHLVINHKQATTVEENVCDSYRFFCDVNGNNFDTTFTKDTLGYVKTFADVNDCDSTVTLNLVVRHNSHRATDSVYTTCGEFLAPSGKTYYVSGIYEDTIVNGNAAQCDSIITLDLTINKGVATTYEFVCDSVIWHDSAYAIAGTYFFDVTDQCADTLYLGEVRHATHDVYFDTACQNYTWNFVYDYIYDDVTEEMVPNTYASLDFNKSGAYTNNYTNAEGCASVDTMKLVIGKGRTFAEDVVTACDSYTWVVNDSLIGTFTQSIETQTSFTNPATKCDSVTFLKLTIVYAPVTDTAATICESQLPYTWRGITMTEAGVEEVTFQTLSNCDSIVRFTLTVNQEVETNLTASICLGNGYNENGFDIAASEMPTAGEYTFTENLATVNGCDSIVTLVITVGDIITNSIDVAACDSYTWNGETYTESGAYTYTHANDEGCSTVDTLHLTINVNHGIIENQTVCVSYTWNGNVYDEAGTYNVHFADENGCFGDSVLNLTIAETEQIAVTETVCDSYTWTDGNGETYTESGVYTYDYTTNEGCNGVMTLTLTVNHAQPTVETLVACDSYSWNGETYTVSGVYTNEFTDANGCNGVDTLNLTINNSVATNFADETCNAYVWEGSYYTESGSYTKTFEAANGCDSVVTLTLTVNQPVAETITETACGSYTWNGITYNASGNYTQTDVAANGCDSVTTLVLTINQPVTGAFTDEACESYTWNGETYTESGAYTQTFTAANGCDSVVTLTLTINAPANTTEDVTACESYTWHGQVYTTNGAYTYNFTDNNGCAAVATLNLTINTPANTNETVTACNSYSWNNQTYTSSGVYTSTFVDANGCNATATLSLTINNPVNATFTVTECESYTWHGQVYTVSGNYTYTTTAANGCDSIETLVLTINQPTTATVYAEACGSYTWNGTTYTQPGAYPYTTTGSNGCDSTVTLLLNLMQPVQTIINQTACDSYTWNGTTYTTSGSYSVTFTAANNCDSVVTLNLTVNNSVSNSLTATACESYTWNGQTYATSGSYTQVFTAHNGCDSTVTLALTINTPTTATVTETACSSFDWNGETYTTSGSYTYTTTGANGCDSVTTLLLTINLPVYTNLEANAEGSYSWNGETYTESGVYTYTTTAANGCDSVVTLTLTITPVYTVTLVSQNEAWGSVSESGTIAENGYFTATATANEGYEFVAWMNGNDTVSTSSTYIFQVTEDITLTAVFAEVQGISAVDMNNVVIYSTDSRIFVNGAEGYDVYVYDVNGRVINRQMKAADAIEFRMTTTGVYLVKVGNAPAKRVVVVR